MFYLVKKTTEQQVLDHFDNLSIDGVGYETTTPKVVWNKFTPVPPAPMLTFTAQENTSFSFYSYEQNVLSYSLDSGETWNDLYNMYAYEPSGPTATTTLHSGETIMWKCDNATIDVTDTPGVARFESTGRYKAAGDVRSLLYGDDYAEHTNLNDNYALGNMFLNATGLTDASGIVIPFTNLTLDCCINMFNGCTNLVSAPAILPATGLDYQCYYYMFKGCTSLVNPPQLPATAMKDSCYESMFRECTSLVTAPELPATDLRKYDEYWDEYYSSSCYNEMFYGCSSLNRVRTLAVNGTNSGSGNSNDWLYGVAANGTFIKAAGSNWATNSDSGIPAGWTTENA